MNTSLTREQETVLTILVNHGDSNGFPRERFIRALYEADIKRPMKVIKELCQKKLMRFDSNSRVHKGGAYKPLKPAYIVLGRMEPA